MFNFDDEWLSQAYDRIDSGMTLVVSTQLRAVNIDKRVLNRWRKSGNVLFKVRDGHLFMARGRSFDDVSFCKFQWYK